MLNGYGRLILSAVITVAGGLFLTLLIASANKWREFELTMARQTLVIEEVKLLRERLYVVDRKNAEQDLTIEGLLQRERMQHQERGK